MSRNNLNQPSSPGRSNSLTPPGLFSRPRGENTGSARQSVSNVLEFSLSDSVAQDNPSSYSVRRYNHFANFRRHLNIPVTPPAEMDEHAEGAVGHSPSVSPDTISPSPRYSSLKPEEKKKDKKKDKKKGNKNKNENKEKKDIKKPPEDSDEEELPPTFRWVHIEIV
ncbi:hypothetical protein Ocin01_02041 [Orchesella cincta]|uniref:Uncharacterized protein n=1 Tax=Orchesella cincta TaxID=48709 RepID=A0A1D2NHA4_ORCCI|nr:hypothetical protein Ocin01_02041 [Orchesella cincta]